MNFPDKNSLYPLTFEPIYREVMWGGNMFSEYLGRQLPETDMPIGESWEISDREDAVSIVDSGPLKGKTIKELINFYNKDLIGKNFSGNRFPLLIKLIDAGKRLSLQVHPDETAAAEINEGAEAKTEMWYIIAAKPGAKIMAGLKSHTTKQQFIERMHSKQIEECLQIFESVPSDAFFISAGRIHAIDAGNLLLEIQQNSNTTYRVSDWGRVGADGKPRELHVEKALKCIDFRDRTSPRISGVSDKSEYNRKFPIINRCPYFRVDDLRLVTQWQDNTFTTDSFHLVTAINNPVRVGDENRYVDISQGRTCLVPACFGPYNITLLADSETNIVRTTL